MLDFVVVTIVPSKGFMFAVLSCCSCPSSRTRALELKCLADSSLSPNRTRAEKLLDLTKVRTASMNLGDSSSSQLVAPLLSFDSSCRKAAAKFESILCFRCSSQCCNVAIGYSRSRKCCFLPSCSIIHCYYLYGSVHKHVRMNANFGRLPNFK